MLMSCLLLSLMSTLKPPPPRSESGDSEVCAAFLVPSLFGARNTFKSSLALPGLIFDVVLSL